MPIIEAKGLRVDANQASWRKSSASGPFTDNCVEVAFVDSAVLVRDDHDPAGPVLLFTHAEWAAFGTGMKAGEFDL
jgi:hypothetical protein